MKRPYLDQYQREAIRLNTSSGDIFLLGLEFQKLGREIKREIIKLKTWIQNKMLSKHKLKYQKHEN